MRRAGETKEEKKEKGDAAAQRVYYAINSILMHLPMTTGRAL